MKRRRPDMAKLGPPSGTACEIAVLAALRRFRPRPNDRSVPGSPDAHLPRRRIAVFADGRFWHDPEYAGARTRRHHAVNWRRKAERNRERDARVDRELAARGYLVVRIWDTCLRGAGRHAVLAELVRLCLRHRPLPPGSGVRVRIEAP